MLCRFDIDRHSKVCFPRIESMTDSFDREITYLRLSVTDKCNLLCRYCMQAEGVCSLPHERMLSQEEMVMAVRASC